MNRHAISLPGLRFNQLVAGTLTCLILLLSAGAAPFPTNWNVLPVTPLVDFDDVVPNDPIVLHSLTATAELLQKRTLPANPSAWQTTRAAVDQAFRQSLGLDPLPPRTPLHPQITSRHEFGDFVVENLLFDSRPGFPVTAHVYKLRDSTGRQPAVLSPVGHFLSAGKNARDVQARCLGLASLGFVVLSYDPIGQGERLDYRNVHHDAGYPLLLLGETIAGWMVWDSIRALDYLETRDDVDASRLGITGNSGGGLNTLFTSAIDARARAAVVVGFTFEFRHWLKFAGAHCTCTHLPGIFQHAEWFEIAGLVAPRALMMIQGEHDGSFPISGARSAARDTRAVYAALGASNQVRFVELSRQPHAYTRPFREPMYEWMTRHLLPEHAGVIVAEDRLPILEETDPRLLVDPTRAVLSNAPTVLDLAREQAWNLVRQRPARPADLAAQHQRQLSWIAHLAAPPAEHPHFYSPSRSKPVPVPGGTLEKLSFIAEDGVRLPVLLWSPPGTERPRRVLLIANAQGKAAVAESGWVPSLLEAGWTVLAMDLRGRGETLGRYAPNYDTNFRLIANQVLAGQPLAGRRAYDVRRAVDFLERKEASPLEECVAIGIGDDALPVLLAGCLDPRINRLVLSQFGHSFLSRMQARPTPKAAQRGEQWNDPQLDGRVRFPGVDLDFGTLIPHALQVADVPELLRCAAPRRVWFCQAQEPDDGLADRLRTRFRETVTATGDDWLTYSPNHPLNAASLLDWLASTATPPQPAAESSKRN
ncbi:MAG: acetylxylan esterase [Verrucomicrobiales bacterium]|nr:acetylxylan esterase [Verrucomicrobiales bacterium]